MLKRDELNHPSSCLTKARSDEILFILLERDKAAPATIRFWVAERLRLGLNAEDDNQILEALGCAELMEKS